MIYSDVHLADYAFVSFEYLRAREEARPIKPYLQNQDQINLKMRMILIDWMVEVIILI